MAVLSQEHFDEKVVEIFGRFNKTDQRFDTIERRLDEHDVKLDAIMELLTYRDKFEQQVRDPHAQGIKIDIEKYLVR